jgi:S-adenosylmethionine decarboxylase
MNGQHAIIESYGELSKLSASDLLELMSEAAVTAGATILGSQVHEFGEGCGHTGVLLLAESHITVHTWPENAYAAFDVFMCGDAAIQKAIDVIRNADVKGCHTFKILNRGEQKPSTMTPSRIADSVIDDAPLLMDKLYAVDGVVETNAREGLIEAIKFLLLCGSTSETLTPSSMIDNIWHELVLFTRTYSDICHRHVGHFIHHQPSNDKAKESNQYQHTLMLYRERFGAPSKHYWNESNVFQCGTCENH